MRPRKSSAFSHCEEMMDSLALDHRHAVMQAEILLKSYRGIVWACKRRAWETVFEAHELGGKDLGCALVYLASFAPDVEREKFQEKVSSLFKTHWLVELVDQAMGLVYEYPNDGPIYFEILNKRYMVKYPYSEVQLLDALSISRSTYYEKKRDAIMVLALVLWGHIIPTYMEAPSQPSSLDLPAV